MRLLRAGLAMVLLTMAGCALAVTIEPGTYKLEWRVPADDEHVTFAGRKSTELTRLDKTEDVKVTGLASTAAMWGTMDSRAVVLDESKGDGTGYDTAYILSYSPEWTQYDAAKAEKIALTANETQWTGGSEVDLVLGQPGEQITKRAQFSLTVFRAEDLPGLAILTIRGGWHGKLRTDAGDLDVELADVNGNGLYTDVVKLEPGQDMPNMGDMMILGSPPVKPMDQVRLIVLSPVFYYDARLYNIHVHPTGETVDIRPYAGERGHLRIAARDGFNKPADCAFALIFGPSMMFAADPSSDLPVVPGRYRCKLAVIRPKGVNSESGIALGPKDAALVTRDGLGVVKVGGPFKAIVEPGAKYVTAKRGSDLQIKFAFVAGADQFQGLENADRKALVNIRDSKGKLLHSGKSGFG